MPQYKTVHLDTDEPFVHDPGQTQLWADVWVRFKARPGRRTHYWAPTLISHTDLLRELDSIRQLQEKHPELDYSDDIRHFEEAVEALKRQPVYFEPAGEAYDGHAPNLYSASERIGRDDAEAMIRHLMTHLGYGRVKFRWSTIDLASEDVGA